jgi:hypothetical protein
MQAEEGDEMMMDENVNPGSALIQGLVDELQRFDARFGETVEEMLMEWIIEIEDLGLETFLHNFGNT